MWPFPAEIHVEQFEYESKYACEIVLNTGKLTANNLQVYVTLQCMCI